MDWGEFGKKIIGKKMIVLLLVTGAVYFFLQYLTPLSAPVLLAMLFDHNFWANDEADESASAFSQTPQCHSASHRGNSVAGGVTLDSGVLDARQPARYGSAIWNCGSRSGWKPSGGCVAAWERLLVWTLRIWKIRSVADYRRGWIHWKKIFCRECFPSLCSMCSGSRSWEDFW